MTNIINMIASSVNSPSGGPNAFSNMKVLYLCLGVLGLMLFVLAGVRRIRQQNISISCFLLLFVALFCITLRTGIYKQVSPTEGWAAPLSLCIIYIFAVLLLSPKILSKKNDHWFVVELILLVFIVVACMESMVSKGGPNSDSSQSQSKNTWFLIAIVSMLVFILCDFLIYSFNKKKGTTQKSFASFSAITAVGSVALVMCLVCMGVVASLPRAVEAEHGGPGMVDNVTKWGINFSGRYISLEEEGDDGYYYKEKFYSGDAGNWSLFIKGEDLNGEYDKGPLDRFIDGNSNKWGFHFFLTETHGGEREYFVPSTQKNWQLNDEGLYYEGKIVYSFQIYVIDPEAQGGYTVYYYGWGICLPGSYIFYPDRSGGIDFVYDMQKFETYVLQESLDSNSGSSDINKILFFVSLVMAYLSILLLAVMLWACYNTSLVYAVSRVAAIIVSSVLGSASIACLIVLLVLGLFPLIAVLPLSIALGFLPICLKPGAKAQKIADEANSTELVFKCTTTEEHSYPSKPKIDKREKRRKKIMENQVLYYNKIKQQ